MDLWVGGLLGSSGFGRTLRRLLDIAKLRTAFHYGRTSAHIFGMACRAYASSPPPKETRR
jgi:hypothetical protein